MRLEDMERPEPEFRTGRLRYTLTTYDPVRIEVEVRKVSEKALDSALQFTIQKMGGGPESLKDEAWIRKTFPGVMNAEQLRYLLRQQINDASAKWTEQQKSTECAKALVKRLIEKVPPSSVWAARQSIVQSFEFGLKKEEMTKEEYLAQSGMTSDELQKMFDEQAQQAAEQEAAIDAWADYRKVSMSNEEIPRYLPLPHADKGLALREIMIAGRLEEARMSARRMKAIAMVVDECVCVYRQTSAFTEAEGFGSSSLSMA